MADVNIYIRNALNEKKSKTDKLSTKGSGVNKATPTKSGVSSGFRKNSLSKATSGGSAAASSMGSFGATAAVIYAGLKVSQKVYNFGINIWEARTGESMKASNLRAYGETAISGGTNILLAQINYGLIGSKVVRRQNIEAEYNRELYNMNYLNMKHKGR